MVKCNLSQVTWSADSGWVSSSQDALSESHQMHPRHHPSLEYRNCWGFQLYSFLPQKKFGWQSFNGIYVCRLNCPNLTRSFQNLHPRFAAGTSAVEPSLAEVPPDKCFHEPVVSWVKEYCIDHESQNPRCFHFQIVLRNFKSFSNLRWGIPTSKKNLMFFFNVAWWTNGLVQVNVNL